METLIVFFIVAVLCIFVIMKSAGFAITAIASYARKTGLSEYLVGFLIVSVGTSLPELSTAFFASTAGHGGLILGDIIGANIIDVTLVLGISAIIAKKIKTEGKIINKTLLTVFGIAILPIILGVDGTLSRLDGILMIIAFLFYVGNMLWSEGKLGKIKKNVAWKDIWQDMVVFLGCLIALLLAARWLVMSSVFIAQDLGVPVYIVGLVFVALGTTVPELTVQLKSIIKGLHGIAFGNILGSVIVNTSLILGFAAIVNPIKIELAGFLTAGLFMVLAVSVAIFFMERKEITWKHGIMLVSIYVVYLVAVIGQALVGN